MVKKILIIIAVLCVVGGLTGLIIYLTKSKKGGKTPSPPGPSPPGPSPPGPSPHGHSPHGHSPHGHSPHGHSPHGHSPHGHSPHGQQSVTFTIENMPSFSYPCPSPSPSPSPKCSHPPGFMIGWSEGNDDIGIPRYGSGAEWKY